MHVYNNPINTFIAGFLGTPPMNLLNAEILEKNDKLSIILDDMLFTLPIEEMEVLKKLKGKKFILGIRPEDIRITSKIENERMNKEIALIEHTGNELLLYTRALDQEIIVKSPRQHW